MAAEAVEAAAAEPVAARPPVEAAPVPVWAVAADSALCGFAATAHNKHFSGLTNLFRLPLYHALIRSVTLF